MNFNSAYAKGEYFTEFPKIAFWKSLLTLGELGRVSLILSSSRDVANFVKTFHKWVALGKQEIFPNNTILPSLEDLRETFPVLEEALPNQEAPPNWATLPNRKTLPNLEMLPDLETLPNWENFSV